MVNKPLIRPYFLGGVALGGVARIPMIKANQYFSGAMNGLGSILGTKTFCYQVAIPTSCSFENGCDPFHLTVTRPCAL